MLTGVAGSPPPVSGSTVATIFGFHEDSGADAPPATFVSASPSAPSRASVAAPSLVCAASSGLAEEGASPSVLAPCLTLLRTLPAACASFAAASAISWVLTDPSGDVEAVGGAVGLAVTVGGAVGLAVAVAVEVALAEDDASSVGWHGASVHAGGSIACATTGIAPSNTPALMPAATTSQKIVPRFILRIMDAPPLPATATEAAGLLATVGLSNDRLHCRAPSAPQTWVRIGGRAAV